VKQSGNVSGKLMKIGTFLRANGLVKIEASLNRNTKIWFNKVSGYGATGKCP